MLTKLSPLKLALIVSVGAHVALLTLRFADPRLVDVPLIGNKGPKQREQMIDAVLKARGLL